MCSGFLDVFPSSKQDGVKDFLGVVNLEVDDICVLLRGESTIDVGDWKAHARVEGPAGTDVERWFWLIVEDISEDQRKDLLQFVCAVRSTPVGGFVALESKFTLAICEHMQPTSFPVAHTCFNKLELPAGCRSQQQLRRGLLVCIREARNMGIA